MENMNLRLTDMYKVKRSNIHLVRVLERQEKNGTEAIFKEIMAENFPELSKYINPLMKYASNTP